MAMNEEFNNAMHESTMLYIESKKPGFEPEFTGKSIDEAPKSQDKKTTGKKTTGKELTGKEI